jgi:hypothetical protein
MHHRELAALPAALVFACAGIAQDLRLTNAAPLQRTQWVDVALPISDAMPLTTLCRFEPAGFIAMKGADVGQHSTMFHVLATLGAHESTVGHLVPVTSDPAAIPFPTASDWVVDAPLDVFARPAVISGGVEHRLVVYEFTEVEHVPARRVYHLRGRMDATPLVFDEWLYVYAMQDAVRIEVTFTNSDPRTSDLSFDFDMMWIESRELFEVDYRTVLGDVPPSRQLSVPTHQSYGRYIQLLSGNRTLGRSEQMFFSGWMLCSNHSGATPTASSYSAGGITVVQQPGDRIRTLAATRFGPASGVYSGWAGKWLAFGMVPELPVGTVLDGGWGAADASANAFQALLRVPADLYSQRPRGLRRVQGIVGGDRRRPALSPRGRILDL